MLFQLLFGSGRMQTFTVHEGPSHPADRIDRAEALTFVKDGFSLQACILGPLWLLAHKLWLGALCYVAAAIAVLAANEWLGLPTVATALAFLGLHLLIGFEADSIARAGLEQNGWSSIGSVSGANALDCERRFFETWLHDQPVLASKTTEARRAAPPVQVPVAATVTPRGSVAGRLAGLWRGKE